MRHFLQSAPERLLRRSSSFSIHGPRSTQYTQLFFMELLNEAGIRATLGHWPPELASLGPRLVINPQSVKGLAPFRTAGLQMELNGSNGAVDRRVLRAAQVLPVCLDYSMNNIDRLSHADPVAAQKLIHAPIVPMRFLHDQAFCEFQSAARVAQRPVSWTFFGTLNERRASALNAVLNVGKGALVASAFQGHLYRQLLMSKVVIDIAFYPDGNRDVERSGLALALGARYLGEFVSDGATPSESPWVRHFKAGDWKHARECLQEMLRVEARGELSDQQIDSLPTADALLRQRPWIDVIGALRAL